MAKKTVGKEARFLNALLTGKTISRKQAKTQYKLGNPSATVLRIQESGYQLQRHYAVSKSRVPGTKIKIRTVKYSIA
jgi:hypothetical protein